MTSPDPLSIPFVLVADDDEVMRMLMSETLIQAGFEVCAAEDGETAPVCDPEFHDEILDGLERQDP